jgi:hypothetical protein
MGEAVISPHRNLARALADELERVVILRENWKQLIAEGLVGSANMAPGIALMTVAIDAAKDALGGDDAIASLKAYEALRGFRDA